MAEVVGSSNEWLNPEWRVLVRATAEAYLAPDFHPRQRISARRLAKRYGFSLDSARAAYKAERYAVAAAAISRITSSVIAGNGAAARYRPECTSINGLSFFGDVFDTVEEIIRSNFYRSARAVEMNKTTFVAYYLRRFAWLSVGRIDATAGLIRIGGTMPTELAFYGRSTARALSQSPLTKDLPAEQRIAIAHHNTTVLTGRASQHLDTLLDGPGWLWAEKYARVRWRGAAAHHNAESAHPESYAIVGKDNKALLRTTGLIKRVLDTPTLRCPAHQQLFDSTESALQQQLHAGINAFADYGAFDPGLAIAAPEAF